MLLIWLCCSHVKFSSVIHGWSKVKVTFTVRVMAVSSRFVLIGSPKVKRSANLLFVNTNLLHWQPAFVYQPKAIYVFKLGPVYCNLSSDNTSIASLQVRVCVCALSLRWRNIGPWKLWRCKVVEIYNFILNRTHLDITHEGDNKMNG
jgi:hypothetical protein